MAEQTISISGGQYTASRKKLRLWLELERIKLKLNKAVENNDIDGIADQIYLYISTAFDVEADKLEDADWHEIESSFYEAVSLNSIDLNIPLFKYPEKVHEEDPWDYEGRQWYAWSYRFAKQFGWSLEYIAELDVDDAIKLLQEILVHSQLDKEWEWMLSENSVGYDEVTKKSKINELPRPDWMKKNVQQPKAVKIPASLLPVGNVVKYEPKKKSAPV